MKAVTVLPASPLPSVRNFFLTIWTGSARWSISPWHRHFEVIKKLVARGTYFFDYGNSFMKAIYDAGVKEISRNGVDEKDGFIWPSYVEDIMGPELFDYGYGPFRWVCLSGKHEDLVRPTKQLWIASIRTGAGRTGITTTGFAMPRQTACCRYRGAHSLPGCGRKIEYRAPASTAWCGMVKSGRSCSDATIMM